MLFVTDLRQQPGGTIGVAGSPSLVRSLLDQGLLDELTLLISPVIAGGRRKRLFAEDAALTNLELVEAQPTSSGALARPTDRSASPQDRFADGVSIHTLRPAVPTIAFIVTVWIRWDAGDTQNGPRRDLERGERPTILRLSSASARMRTQRRRIGTACKSERVELTAEIIELGGGDPFEHVLRRCEKHRVQHGCAVFPAGPAVMQLTAAIVRAARPRRLLDLGCGLGYSTLWLARAAGSKAHVVGIDGDDAHIELARIFADDLRMADRIEFVTGQVVDVLASISQQVDAIHDDAWFAAAPAHLDLMIGLLRRGGVLTMPNWFLLTDAITGAPSNDWTQFAGETWAADAVAYARVLAARSDIDITWVVQPPLAIATKR